MSGKELANRVPRWMEPVGGNISNGAMPRHDLADPVTRRSRIERWTRQWWETLEGRVHVHVSEVFSFEATLDAIARVERGHLTGKVVIDTDAV